MSILIQNPAVVSIRGQKKTEGKKNEKSTKKDMQLKENEFFFPSRSYTRPLAISYKKFNDLQHLK